MESQHMSQKVFAQFTGISEGSLSGVFNERTRPTIQMVETIHSRLPNISIEWLMFGTGPMYTDKKSDDSSSATDPSSTLGQDVFTQSPEFGTSLFDAPASSQQASVENTPNNSAKTVVKYVDKPKRNITEIRIFYDDQTWETFVPKE